MHTLLFLFLALPAFACKPAPLAECKPEEGITLDQAALQKLEDATKEFQTTLDDSILEKPANRTSCFNSHFALHYLKGLQRPITCRGQLNSVKTSVEALLRPESPERQAVKAPKARAKLLSLSKKTQSALMELVKAHSDR